MRWLTDIWRKARQSTKGVWRDRLWPEDVNETMLADMGLMRVGHRLCRSPKDEVDAAPARAFRPLLRIIDAAPADTVKAVPGSARAANAISVGTRQDRSLPLARHCVSRPASPRTASQPIMPCDLPMTDDARSAMEHP